MTKSYFASFEADVRKARKDEELQRDLVGEMAVKRLARHSEVKAIQYPWNHIGHGNPHNCYVEFSDAMIDGVAAIIMDELRKSQK